MSEDVLEWRRRWAPDLSALPWTRFTIDGNTVFMKSHFTQTSYSVLVYDFHAVWQEIGEKEDVENKAKVCNPNVEAPLGKLLQHLEEVLQSQQKSAKYSLRYDSDEEEEEEKGGSSSLSIKITSKLAQGVPFSWTLGLSRANDQVASTHLTVPLLTMVSELMRRERELERVIKKKDEEIEDYKMSGAKVSRRHKQTSVYDGKAFNQEMLHSKAFQSEVECSGERAFDVAGQELYREVMVTRAWLKRPAEKDDESDEENPGIDGDPSLPDPAPTGPSWATRLPGSVVGDIPSMADTLSPVKSSPSKSPMKASPSVAAQETEMMRREALEKRLAEEKAKQQVKKKKKKLF